MDKNKLILPISILLGCIILGGFFYISQVSKQKSIEKQQQIEIEQKRQEQLDEELKEQQAKEESEQGLSTCLADADINYSNQWYEECKSRGELTSRCILIHGMSFKEYSEKYNIPTGKGLDAILEFYKEQDECSCRLPLANADRISDSLENNKAGCYKRYPQ